MVQLLHAKRPPDRAVVGQGPSARFTKHLKPKIFLSAIQFVWHLRKS